MDNLLLPKMPVIEMQWALSSPKLLYSNCPLDFTVSAPFQLPLLYANDYLLTFSLITLIFIMMHLLYGRKKKKKGTQICTQTTLSDSSGVKNHIRVRKQNPWSSQNSKIFAIPSPGRLPYPTKCNLDFPV